MDTSIIELSATELAYVAIAFTIVGALVGALATIFAARLTAEYQRLYEESAKFRAAFVDEKIGLRRADRDAFTVLTGDALLKHKRAKVLFEPWVPPKQSIAFEQAWKAYESKVHTAAPGSINNRTSECNAALQDIEAILSFAQRRH